MHGITILLAMLLAMALSEPDGKRARLQVSFSHHPLDTSHRLVPPKGPSDADFLRQLRAWKKQLLGKHISYKNIRPEADEKPWRAEGDRHLHWHQPQCWTVFKYGELVFKRTIHRHRHEPEKHNKVYYAQSRVDGKRYAVKSFHKNSEFLAEMQFMSIADHPNIVKPVCWIPESRHNERPLLVMEWVEGGQKSGEYARSLPTSDPIREMAAQLVSAIMYTHWLGYSHSDLKPDNVMVNGDGQVVVIDWGFAEPLGEIAPGRGTPSTYPPEKDGTVVVNPLGDIITEPSDNEDDITGSWPHTLHEGADWWAVGLTVLMWYGGWVNEAAGSSARYHPIRRRKEHGKYEFDNCSKAVPLYARQFVHLLVQANPMDRMLNNARLCSFLQEQPIFEGIDWEKYGGKIVHVEDLD
jgi:hypothetical protein